MSERIDIDVRWLEPPEPFERVVAALETLPQGATLRVLIHRLPRPLFQWLEREGWSYRHGFDPEGFFEILIAR
ncbi:MAG: DUF2249 domain-containing protein [Burkholderiales bacterium]|nr:DUF2249 domain-containing protein [Burkholderiales bacterium]